MGTTGKRCASEGEKPRSDLGLYIMRITNNNNITAITGFNVKAVWPARARVMGFGSTASDRGNCLAKLNFRRVTRFTCRPPTDGARIGPSKTHQFNCRYLGRVIWTGRSRTTFGGRSQRC